MLVISFFPVRFARQLSTASSLALVRRTSGIPTTSHPVQDPADRVRLRPLPGPVLHLHDRSQVQHRPVHAASLHQVHLSQCLLPNLFVWVSSWHGHYGIVMKLCSFHIFIEFIVTFFLSGVSFFNFFCFCKMCTVWNHLWWNFIIVIIPDSSKT